MASERVVKEYLAQWLQLGKRLFLQSQDRFICIDRVVAGENYSREFEQLWQEISGSLARETYLEGTYGSVQDLLGSQWELLECARCRLLSPCMSSGPRDITPCPCDDLKSWPNLETIPPRVPVNSSMWLTDICDRLKKPIISH